MCYPKCMSFKALSEGCQKIKFSRATRSLKHLSVCASERRNSGLFKSVVKIVDCLLVAIKVTLNLKIPGWWDQLI